MARGSLPGLLPSYAHELDHGTLGRQLPTRLFARPALADPIVHRNRLDHVYIQVADDVARRIRDRKITIKLPAERALAEEYEVSYITIRHAMAILRQRSLVVSIHGRGTFVAALMS